MGQPLGRFSQIDGLKFAETAGSLRSTCRVADFPRLQDLLTSNAGELEYQVLGASDEMGRPALSIAIAGELQLTCQRCLQPMGFPLQVKEMLVLARSESEIDSQPVDPEVPDRVLAGKDMDVGTLLEDEILLAIPFAPRHEHCLAADAERGAAKPSPFADLRGLLNRGGRARN